MGIIKNNLSYAGQVCAALLRGEPHKARSLALKKYTRLLKNYYGGKPPEDSIDIMAQEWDYLIILDACRYDYFADMYSPYLSGKLEKKISRGTSTSNWLEVNFTEFYDNTVYVSSNPHCSDHDINGFRGSEHFPHIDHVWKYAWDEKLDTVPPDAVSAAALKMRRQHPDKRMIIHYIQPHGPWIGDTRISGEEIGLAPDLSTSGDGKWTVDILVWEMVREGRFDVEKLKKAYADNLTLVLADVQQLVEQLDGVVVVSSDHGEAFGEGGIVSHPSRVYKKVLVEVPWLIIDKGPKQQTQPEAASETQDETSSAEDKLNERLRALGYLD